MRACLCVLAGMLAPQLTSFPRYSDLFGAPMLHIAAPAVLFVLAAVAWLVFRSLPRALRRDAACIAGGAVLFCLQSDSVVADRLDPALAGDSIVVTVRVTDFPQRSPGGTAFVAEPVGDVRVPGRLRLNWFEAPVAIRQGDVWQLELRLRPPSGVRNPGTRDFDTWMLRDRSGATGYVAGGRFTRLVDSGTQGWLAERREGAVARIVGVLGHGPEAAVIAALTVGARHLLTRAQWERFAATGTSHLMAISGLHVGMVGAGAYAMLALALGIAGCRRAHDVALVGGLAAAAAYALVSGFAVPSRRALIMLGLVVLGVLARRVPRPAAIIAGAAGIILLLDPIAVLAPGFQLSFAAVAVLVWAAQRHAPQRGSRLRRAAAGSARLLVLQGVLLPGLAPLTVLHFDRIALAAPLVNGLAVPLFSMFVVPVALAGVLLDGPLAPFGDTLLRAAGTAIGLVDAGLAGIAAIEGASVFVAAVTGVGWLCLVLPAVWAGLPPCWPGRRVAWIGLAGLVLWRAPAVPPGCAAFALLDVGQGMSAVIRTHRSVLVYDAGPAYRSGGDAGLSVVVPYLRHVGVRRIDRIMISHSDMDHAGGLVSLLSAVPAGHVSSGDPLVPAPGEQRVSRCRAGDWWTWEGVVFRVLHPRADATYTRNDASCVLLIEAGRTRVLLAGDIEAGVETELVQSRELPTVDITTVPHHGSRTSSITPYVRALDARVALIPVARYNAWNLPKADIVERWRNVGARVLSTATSGAIEADVCPSGVRLREHRRDFRRRWHGAN